MLRSPSFQFARHYAEMVGVMFAGMLVLGGAMLLAAAGIGVGREELQDEAPAVFLLGMGVSMTAPMVWWMHRRGHTRSANGSMALAMMLPTLATIVFLATGAVTDLDTLLGIEHMAMFPAMLVAMLPFRGEYIHTHAHAHAEALA